MILLWPKGIRFCHVWLGNHQHESPPANRTPTFHQGSWCGYWVALAGRDWIMLCQIGLSQNWAPYSIEGLKPRFPSFWLLFLWWNTTPFRETDRVKANFSLLSEDYWTNWWGGKEVDAAGGYFDFVTWQRQQGPMSPILESLQSGSSVLCQSMPPKMKETSGNKGPQVTQVLTLEISSYLWILLMDLKES